MVQNPTKGPFYMVNLIRFREKAAYKDGRKTELTGRQANELYSPIEFLKAIGARVVLGGDVTRATQGADDAWHQVAIVEYPCPLALFAMSAHPAFQARSVHKDAGVEKSIVIVTHRQPFDAVKAAQNPFPPSSDDPAFHWVRVRRVRDTAQYVGAPTEAIKTGKDAMALYDAALDKAGNQLGVEPRARLKVQGVLIGDGRVWDELRIDYVPSEAAHKQLIANADVKAAAHHAKAALKDAYGLVVAPLMSLLPLPKQQ